MWKRLTTKTPQWPGQFRHLWLWGFLPLTVNDYDDSSHCSSKDFVWEHHLFLHLSTSRQAPENANITDHFLFTWQVISSILPSPLFGVPFHVSVVKHVPPLAVVEGKLIQTWSYFLQQLKCALKKKSILSYNRNETLGGFTMSLPWHCRNATLYGKSQSQPWFQTPPCQPLCTNTKNK